MKRKFSNSKELHEFFLSELKNIVGVYARVESKDGLFYYDIYPVDNNKKLWQVTIRGLIIFFFTYQFYYYIDFVFGRLRAYTYSDVQIKIGTL